MIYDYYTPLNFSSKITLPSPRVANSFEVCPLDSKSNSQLVNDLYVLMTSLGLVKWGLTTICNLAIGFASRGARMRIIRPLRSQLAGLHPSGEEFLRRIRQTNTTTAVNTKAAVATGWATAWGPKSPGWSATARATPWATPLNATNPTILASAHRNQKPVPRCRLLLSKLIVPRWLLYLFL